MSLSFLPADVRSAISNLNYNFISEIRLRKGQPVIIQYKGEYKYLNLFGVSSSADNALVCGEIAPIVNSATHGSIFSYAEQIKNGFITVENGVRIGIAGEYVTQSGQVIAVNNYTSLNIRVPHAVRGCAAFLFEKLLKHGLNSLLIFSKPGLGKTTALRDLAVDLSATRLYNVLIFDERNEISAIDGDGNGYNLGDRVDVVRSFNKKGAIASAIRAMKPDVIITDELYGDDDVLAVKFAADCGIKPIASSHICDRKLLCKLPFDFYAEIKVLGEKPVIYDKNFNIICGCGADDGCRADGFGQ